MPKLRRIFKFSPLILVLYVLYQAWSQVRFEQLLKSLHITSDDFPQSYWTSLRAAKEAGKEPDYDLHLLPSPDPSAHIPPLIHFIWFKNLYHEHLSISEIPTIGSPAPEHCREQNEGFQVNVWNSTAARHFLQDHYDWFLPTYNNYRYPIQRVDAFKYFVLWHYGGIYMDLDVGCRRSLTPLLRFPAWLPKAQPLGVNNDVLASRAKHPLFGEMIHRLQERNKNLFFPYLTIYWSTGPQFTSDVLRSWWWHHKLPAYRPGQSKDGSGHDNFYVLPLPFYSEEYSFFGHSPGGTWHGQDVAVVLWFVDRPWAVALIVVPPVLLCLALIVGRVKRKRCRDSYEALEEPCQ